MGLSNDVDAAQAVEYKQKTAEKKMRVENDLI